MARYEVESVNIRNGRKDRLKGSFSSKQEAKDFASREYWYLCVGAEVLRRANCGYLDPGDFRYYVVEKDESHRSWDPVLV